MHFEWLLTSLAQSLVFTWSSLCVSASSPLFIRTVVIWLRTHPNTVWTLQKNYFQIRSDSKVWVDMDFARMLLDALYSQFHIFLLFSFPHQECLLQKFGKLIQLGGSNLGWAEALCPGLGRWKGWKGYLWAKGLRAAGGQAVGESYVIQFHVQRLHHTILYHHTFKKIPLESSCLWFYPLSVEL